MGPAALIPAWVAPTTQAVADCRWIAHAHADGSLPARQVLAVMDWVVGDRPDEQQALDRLAAADGYALATLAWLLGMASVPPLRLPRRNPDGSVVTADQLYGEYMTGLWGEPEQRAEARQRANRDAATYRHLAELVPH